MLYYFYSSPFSRTRTTDTGMSRRQELKKKHEETDHRPHRVKPDREVEKIEVEKIEVTGEEGVASAPSETPPLVDEPQGNARRYPELIAEEPSLSQMQTLMLSFQKMLAESQRAQQDMEEKRWKREQETRKAEKEQELKLKKLEIERREREETAARHRLRREKKPPDS